MLQTASLAWLLIRCVFIAFIGWCLVVCAERMFNGATHIFRPTYVEKEDGTIIKKEKSKFSLENEDLIRAFALAGILGISKFLINLLQGNVRILAIFFAVIQLVAIAYLMFWWHEGGSSWKEFIVFSLLTGMFFTGACNSVEIAAKVIGTKYLKLLLLIPRILFWGSMGFYAVDALLYHYRKTKTRSYYVWSWVVRVLVTIIVICLLFSCFFNLGLGLGSSQTTTTGVGGISGWLTKHFTGEGNCAPKGKVVFSETGHIALSDGKIITCYERKGGYDPSRDPRVIMFNHQNGDGYENDNAYGLKIAGNTPVEMTTQWAKDFRDSPEQIIMLRVQMGLEDLNSRLCINAH